MTDILFFEKKKFSSEPHEPITIEIDDESFDLRDMVAFAQ